MSTPLAQFFQTSYLPADIEVVNDNAKPHRTNHDPQKPKFPAQESNCKKRLRRKRQQEAQRRQAKLVQLTLAAQEYTRWSCGDEFQARDVGRKASNGQDSPRVPQRRQSVEVKDIPKITFEGGAIPSRPSRRKSIEVDDIPEFDQVTLRALAA